MKRMAALVLALVIALGTLPVTGFAADELEITLKINSEYQHYDKDFILVTLARANYQLLAPARPFAEALEAELSWDEASQQITFTKGDKTAVIAVDAETASDNGEEVKLETPAQLVEDTAYVPVEFVGKALDFRVLREQYGRFVRLITRTTDKTPFDTIKPGMAELISDYHRPVPTEFEKSNDPNDLLWYTDKEYIPEEELTKERVLDTSHLPSGDVIYTEDDMLDSSGSGETANGNWKVVDINDESVDFNRALQIQCTYPPTNTTFFIVKPTKRMEDYVDPKDKYLITFKARIVGGGHVDTGDGKLYFHCEESYIPTWIKSVSETVTIGTEWQTYYFMATGIENANHFGFTTGFYQQTIQIGGFEVQKLSRDADVSMFEEYNKPVDLISPEMSKDAPWRQEAIDRIEEVRKGDLKVKVQDKDGNPVPDADIKFDMFEHEFKFGAVLDTSFWNPGAGGMVDNYVKTLGPNFNAAGCGNGLKIEYYDSTPAVARRKFDDAKNLGIKYFRGHAIFMPSLNTGAVRPYRLYGPDQPSKLDWETFEEYMKNHINRIVEGVPEITEWDVTNEMVNRVTWDNVYGRDFVYNIYKWCKEIFPEGMKLMLCDNQVGNERYWQMLDRYQNDGIEYDMLGYQGHEFDFAHDTSNTLRSRPTKFLEYYDRYVYEYGKSFSLTEYSCSADDEGEQADLMRDSLIAAFSHPGCDGFYIFWYCDVWSGSSAKAGAAPLYDKRFNPKKGLKQWQDLVYNKWWTRDAHTTTDTEGKGQVRGFYGDYDVTVTVGGKEVKTVSAAYHRNYENELVITLD